MAQDRLKWLDGQMADGREFVCGKRFTLADILLFCFLDFGNAGRPAAQSRIQECHGLVRAREGAALRRRMSPACRRASRRRAAGRQRHGSGRGGASPPPAVVPAPGVHPHSVTVGSVLDLTGPLAAEGIAIRNGLTLAFDEINAHGGVGGRKLRLVAKDSAYDPDKARAAARGCF